MERDIFYLENKNNDITESMLNISVLRYAYEELEYISPSWKISWTLWRSDWRNTL